MKPTTWSAFLLSYVGREAFFKYGRGKTRSRNKKPPDQVVFLFLKPIIFSSQKCHFQQDLYAAVAAGVVYSRLVLLQVIY